MPYMCCYQSNNIRNVCFSLGVYTVKSYKEPAVEIDSLSAQFQPPDRDPALCSILSNFRRNVTDLRLQLHQLKQMQVQGIQIEGSFRTLTAEHKQATSERHSHYLTHK